MESAHRRWHAILVPCGLGIWSAGIVLAPTVTMKAALALPVLAAAVVWWAILRPHRWLALFFACLLLTPPLPLGLGDSGVHLAPVLALLGVFAGLMRMPQWHASITPVTLAFGAFVCCLTISLAFAAWYSGPDLAAQSLLRVALFSIGGYVLVHAIGGPGGVDSLCFARFLFLIAIAAALFACADFYFQFPAPAGYEPQFVWLSEGVRRRAQGLFYEASTLGNFCAFFLVMTGVALLRKREDAPCSRLVLAIGAVAFTGAMILSYSRGSIVNVVIACIALAYVRGIRVGKPALVAGAILALGAVVVRFALPSFWSNYVNRLNATWDQFGYTPDGVLSGRLAKWQMLAGFLERHPWHMIFGLGYKTLPYSTYVGEPIIADNTYLQLLAETGIVGLSAFLALNFTILRAGLRAARSRNPRASFFGEWIFCFWAGEMVQMLSGDLITYWRVLPVYFWVLGTAIREDRKLA